MIDSADLALDADLSPDLVRQAFASDIRSELQTALRTVWRYQQIMKDVGPQGEEVRCLSPHGRQVPQADCGH